MNFRELLALFPEDFEYALADLSRVHLAALLDGDDTMGAGEYLRRALESQIQDIENSDPPDNTEKELDDRDRARDINLENKEIT